MQIVNKNKTAATSTNEKFVEAIRIIRESGKHARIDQIFNYIGIRDVNGNPVTAISAAEGFVKTGLWPNKLVISSGEVVVGSNGVYFNAKCSKFISSIHEQCLYRQQGTAIYLQSESQLKHAITTSILDARRWMSKLTPEERSSYAAKAINTLYFLPKSVFIDIQSIAKDLPPVFNYRDITFEARLNLETIFNDDNEAVTMVSLRIAESGVKDPRIGNYGMYEAITRPIWQLGIAGEQHDVLKRLVKHHLNRINSVSSVFAAWLAHGYTLKQLYDLSKIEGIESGRLSSEHYDIIKQKRKLHGFEKAGGAAIAAMVNVVTEVLDLHERYASREEVIDEIDSQSTVNVEPKKEPASKAPNLTLPEWYRRSVCGEDIPLDPNDPRLAIGEKTFATKQDMTKGGHAAAKAAAAAAAKAAKEKAKGKKGKK